MKCPACKGSGKMSITTSYYGTDKPDEVTEMPCFDCDGTGEITEAEAVELQEAKDAWCSCGNPSERTRYYADGENPNCHKHNWVCSDCNKILQVG